MAIRLIFGAPGSGKTYYVVHHLLNNYCRYDKRKKQWSKTSSVRIVHNIDGLVVDGLEDLNKWIARAGGVDKFFSYQFQEKIKDSVGPVIYVIDECSDLFPSNYKGEHNGVFEYFRKHRHLGHDIYLITQSPSLLPTVLRHLSEMTLKALPRSLSFFGGRELRYNVVVGQSYEVVDKRVLLLSPRIYRAYRSMSANETESISNPILKYYGYLLAVLVLCVVYYLPHFVGASDASTTDGSVAVSEASGVLPLHPVQSGSGSSPEGQPDGDVLVDDVPDDPVSHEPVPYVLDYVKVGRLLRISFDGVVYGPATFPYPLRWVSPSRLVAYLPPDLASRLEDARASRLASVHGEVLDRGGDEGDEGDDGSDVEVPRLGDVSMWGG